MKNNIRNYIWNEFDEDVENIAKEVDLNQFQTIVGISKGGLVLAIKLSNWAELPLQIVTACSYKNKKKKELCVEYPNIISIKNPILLIDDIADSGVTLNTIKNHLEVWGKTVKTLTLFYKNKSIIKPDYWVHKVMDKIWVQFPWE